MNKPGCSNGEDEPDEIWCWTSVIDTIMLGTTNPDYSNEWRDQMVEMLSEAFEIKLK